MDEVDGEQNYFNVVLKNFLKIFPKLENLITNLKTRDEIFNFLSTLLLDVNYNFAIMVFFKDILPEIIARSKVFPRNYEKFLLSFSSLLKFKNPIILNEFIKVFNNGPFISNNFMFLENVVSFNPLILKKNNVVEILSHLNFQKNLKKKIFSFSTEVENVNVIKYSSQLEGFHKKKVLEFNNITIKFKSDICREFNEYIKINDVWLEKKIDNPTKPPVLVWTKSTVQKLSEIALYVSKNEPVLIQGDCGSGKTSLIEELARITGNTDLIKIHIDETINSKDIIGMYICSEIPGEFTWLDGTLTKSIKDGRWLLIEDLDLASSDILSILVSVIENRKLILKNECVQINEGFRLFGTIHKDRRRSDFPIFEKWNLIELNEVSEEEINEILQKRYQCLNGIIGNVLKSFIVCKKNKNLCLTLRDLLKWCDRIVLFKDITPINEIIFIEVVSLFFSNRLNEDTKELIELLGGIWNITNERIFYLMNFHKTKIEINENSAIIGRIKFIGTGKKLKRDEKFAFTKQSLKILELISIGVQLKEPILLVGETGTGKTTIVQFLSKLLNQRLIVQNLNQQTDSCDFIGGYKPVDLNLLAKKLYKNFIKLFKASYSKKENEVFLNELQLKLISKEYKNLVQMMQKVCEKSKEMFQVKRRKISDDKKNKLLNYWNKLSDQTDKFSNEIDLLQKNFAFNFEEGTLIKSIKNGHWILLDEINLASNETLERLSGLLEKDGSIFITEKGETEKVVRHKNFRLFACMNPPTDVGKKDLPVGIKNKFTQIYIDELTDKSDLECLVANYLKKYVVNPPIEKIVDFYLTARRIAKEELESGNNQKPQYTLRTLCRSIEYSLNVLHFYNNFEKSLFEGICMSFLTQLNDYSKKKMKKLIKKTFSFNPAYNNNVNLSDYIKIDDFFLKKGNFEINNEVYSREFILTKTIKKRVKELSRILQNPNYCSILLEGPTSSGKTSIVKYLANISGHKFVRINNHETTDIQEYFGGYVADNEGKFFFKEGVLVESVRNGYWIVLDELNLASTEILESLNRLLDDNRELFIPETQEIIKPHPNFKLFATQNPAGVYSGRKNLSRAFKNRFFELQINEIPFEEVSEILQKRYSIPSTISNHFVDIMKDLQLNRSSSNIFAGKLGFITPRDLFKWANRCSKTTFENYFLQGFIILAERLRNQKEKEVVKGVLKKHFKRMNKSEIKYNIENWDNIKKELENSQQFNKIVWTKSMIRLFFLMKECLKYKEPILLVGETGCGKTTICQIFGYLMKKKLVILNCHQNTETSDFIGSLRPVRHRSIIFKKIIQIFDSINLNQLDDDVEMEDNNTILNEDKILNEIEKKIELMENNEKKKNIQNLILNYKSLFKWYDGPLIECMKEGNFFLIDEINLTDDAVIERINSVLEIENREILLSENTNEEECVKADDFFRIFATMNPSGDFGKKELSHALRNRFTEIFVHPLDLEDIEMIIQKRLCYSQYLQPMMKFITKTIKDLNFTIRDVVFWIDFINLPNDNIQNNDIKFLHGCDLIILEGIGIGRNNNLNREEKQKYLKILVECLNSNFNESIWNNYLQSSKIIINKNNKFGCYPFFIDRGFNENLDQIKYVLNNETTKLNLLKILRGLQLKKPILLEGSPGVGKTSLVEIIGKLSGNKVIRINLSEQTDIIDLIGSDLPSEDGSFKWCNGIFLNGLQEGHWIILDELNLASQSILEGLNSVLDYRNEIYVPELNKTFKCSNKFKIFACQNPYKEGSSRKGLPKSFLNRFIKIFIEKMKFKDYLFTVNQIYSNKIDPNYLFKMIEFNSLIEKEFVDKWEFNLRDIFRWCDLILSFQKEKMDNFIEIIYLQRLRNEFDVNFVLNCYERVWGKQLKLKKYPNYLINEKFIQIGEVLYNYSDKKEIFYSTKEEKDILLLHSFLKPLEILLRSIKMNYLNIIIGNSNLGKSFLVQLLSQLTRNKLNIFTVTSSTDTMDLLGNFEQLNLDSMKKGIINRIKLQFDKIILKSFENNQKFEYFNEYFDLISKKVPPLSEIKEIFKKIVNRIENDQEKIKIISKINKLTHLEQLGTKGKFKWSNSILINSIKKGEWVVLDNVNFCNPTVLDRLNSLFEPNGSIILNERGLLKNGEFKVIKPHKNFRLFMIYNPEFGEISRAMKNRGVEIYLKSFSQQDLKSILLNNNLLNLPVIDKNIEVLAKMLNKNIYKEILFKNQLVCNKDFDRSGQCSIYYPNSFLMLNCFKINLNKTFTNILRDGSLLYFYLKNKYNYNVLKYSLLYYLKHATPYDSLKRIELIGDFKNNFIVSVFKIFWESTVIKTEITSRQNTPLFFKPLDLRLINENQPKKTVNKLIMFEQFFLIIKNEIKEKKVSESFFIKKFKCKEEEISINFKNLFVHCNTVIKQKIVSYNQQVQIKELLFQKKLLLKFIVKNSSINPFFIVIWNKFEKKWDNVVNLNRIKKIIKKKYPFYNLKNPLIKKVGKFILISNRGVFDVLNECQKNEFDNHEFNNLVLQAFFSLFFVNGENEVRKLNCFIEDLKMVKKKMIQENKVKNEEMELFSLKKTEIFDENIISVFNNKIILCKMEVLNDEFNEINKIRQLCNESLNFCLRLSSKFNVNYLLPLKVLSERNLCLEEKKNWFFQLKHNIHKSLFLQKKIMVSNFQEKKLNVLLDYLGREIPIKLKNYKINELKKIINFLENDLKIDFITVDYLNLKNLFLKTIKYLDVKSIEDIEGDEMLLPFKTSFEKIFLFFQNPQKNLRELGRIWILLSIIRLNLIKPINPVDPIVKYNTFKEVYSKKLTTLELKLTEFTKIEKFKTSSTDCFLIDAIKEEITTTKDKLEKISKKISTFNRTKSSTELFLIIYRSINDFISSLVNCEKIFSFFNGNDIKLISQKLQVWESNYNFFLQKFEAYLDQKYYEDILYPFVSIMYELKYGVHVLFRSIKRNNDSKTTEITIFKNLLKFKLINNFEHQNALEEYFKTNYDSFNNVKILLRLLNIEIFKKKMIQPFNEKKFSVFLRVFLNVLMKINEINEKRKKENEILIKKKKVRIVIKTDEEIIENQINQFFPNFDLEYEKFLNENEKKELLRESKLIEQEISVVKEEEKIINSIFSILFSNKKKDNVEVIKKISELSLTCILEFKKSFTLTENEYSQDLLLFCLNLQKFNLTKNQNIENDVYNSINVFEIKNIFILLKELMQKMKVININDYFLFQNDQEHPMLEVIKELVNKILSFDVYSPIIKILTGLEILFEKLLQWEEYILEINNKGLSFESIIKKLSWFILKWRKIELTNYKKMLKNKKNIFRKKTSNSYWFKLIRLFLKLNYINTKEMNSEIIKIIEQFIVNSKFGDFKYRLKLLSVIKLVFTSNNDETILNIFNNFCDFFSQFCLEIKNQTKELKIQLKKRLTDFLKLTKWENLNVISIKKNLKNCRSKISKLMIKYEQEILTKNFKNFFMNFYYQTTKTTKLKHIKINQIIDDKSFTVNKTIVKIKNVINDHLVNGKLTTYLNDVYFKFINQSLLNIDNFLSSFKNQVNKNIKKRLLIELVKNFQLFLHKKKFKTCLSFNSIFKRKLTPNVELYQNIYLYQRFRFCQNKDDLVNKNLYPKEIKKFNFFVEQMLECILIENGFMVKINEEKEILKKYFKKIKFFVDGECRTVYCDLKTSEILSIQNKFVNNLNFFIQKRKILSEGESVCMEISEIFNEKEYLLKNKKIENFLRKFKLYEELSDFLEFQKKYENIFQKKVEKLVDFNELKTKILLSIQIIKEKNEFFCFSNNNDNEDIVFQINNFFELFIKDIKLSVIISKLDEIFTQNETCVLISNEFKEILLFLNLLLTSIDFFESILNYFYNSLNKLLFKSQRLFITLFLNDFYPIKEEQDQDKQNQVELDEGGQGFDQGEGVVNTDINEIENEEQIMNGNDVLENKQEKLDEQNEETIEPETDFFSKLFDKDDEMEDEDENSDDDEDKEMGEVEKDDRKIDQQFWGEENELEEEEIQKGEELKQKTNVENSDEMQADEDEVKEKEEGEKIEQKKHQSTKLEFESDGEDEQVEQEEFIDNFYDQNNEENEENGENEFPEKMEIDDPNDDDDCDEFNDENKNEINENEKEEEEKLNFSSLNQPEIDNEENEIKNEEFDKMDIDEDEEDESKSVDPLLNDENENDVEMDGKKQDEDVQFQEDLEETPFGVHMTSGDSVKKEDEMEIEEEEKQNNFGGEENTGNNVNKNQFGDNIRELDDNLNEKQEFKNEIEMKFDPLRCLGDLIQEWKEKLNIVERDEKKETVNEKNDGENYEFKKKDDKCEDESELQTFGPTNENFDVYPEKDEVMEDKEEDGEITKNDFMDIDVDDKSEKKKNFGEINEEENKIKQFKEQESFDDDTNIENLFQKRENVYEDNEIITKNVQSDNEDLNIFQNEKSEISTNFNEQFSVELKNEYNRILEKILSLSQELCEKLRLILTPTIINKLSGDFKTGKRLNLKKIIPFIASDYRKDKIWLRRVKPNKRDYNVVVCIDDSLSMKKVAPFALESLILICKSLTQLEIGKICVMSFGEKTEIVHPFNKPFTNIEGISIISKFSFNQQQTKVYELLSELFIMLKKKSNRFDDYYNITFIISDGQISDYNKCKNLTSKIHKDKNIIVFLMIDKKDDPIIEKKIVEFNGKKIDFFSVLDKFPFPYYIIVRNLKNLPYTISSALRQFFQNVNQT